MLALHSLDTLSDVRIKAFTLLFLIKTLSIQNPSLSCLVTLLSVVNNFSLITSFSFNYLVVIIVRIAFKSSVINLINTKNHCFTIIHYSTSSEITAMNDFSKVV